jgi:polysaccharide pyruvyl transferase WcaK-like protein
MNLFFVHPHTRNIGNDIIGFATSKLLYEIFGAATNIINIPAMQGPQFGGLVARQIYDMNRFADGIVVGGGNLFENGQISYDAQAVQALNRPMLLIALSHGRIAGRDGALEDRTDAMHPDAIRHLVGRSTVALVRDIASQAILRELGVETEIGGCPTLFLPPNVNETTPDGDLMISLRHPSRMNIPPTLQWRIADDLRRLITALRVEFARPVRLACHDYFDLEFAAGFPEAVTVYFDDVHRYIAALRTCAMNICYRLHGFLPCLAFGTHSIHLSYDERGRSMMETAGMSSWDINLLEETDCVSAIMDRARDADRYRRIRSAAQPVIAELRETTMAGVQKFRAILDGAGAVEG